MKKLLLFFLAIFLSIPVFAQLEVKEGSFKEVKGFVNINTDKMYDDNDKPYAVLKIKTENINNRQRRELSFSGDAATFFEIEYKQGEVWLYLSYYATFIKISHPDLSSTEYYFPYDMEPKKGYELTLVNKSYMPVTPIQDQYNYIVITADRKEAMIYIDGVYMGNERASQSFEVGEKHGYRIECDDYETVNDTITITSGDPISIDVKLVPTFGYINVTTEPESGAIVFIDGVKVGTSPYKSDRLQGGEHTLRVVKEMYNTYEGKVLVGKGDIYEAKIKMVSNFVSVKITTDSKSEIYVDKELKGKGSWSGSLSVGKHILEAKKDLHKTTSQIVDIAAGNNKDIVLPDPKPICGAIDFNSEPIGANIIIDGKNHGTTPRIIRDVIIGSHEVKLELKGYNTFKTTVVVEENDLVNINETLLSNAKPKKEKQIKEKKMMEFDRYYFATLNASYSNYGDLAYGITFGNVNKYGWFVSAMTNFNFSGFSSDYECNNDFMVNDIYPIYSGKETYTSLSVMGGFIYRISDPIALRIGAGYGVRNTVYETIDNKTVKNKEISASGVDASLGVQFKFGKFVGSLECLTTNFKIFEAKIGLGIGFDK